tara:strand:+ start:276 stop:2408 length:2133 start_codon:yes stop_codon:yes gene_type:complete
MSDSRRSSLAKLMATENISVEHKNIPTAYFNTKDRVLGLPIWKNASKDVYDLLVGHEVSHALYTPVNWIDGIESIDPSNFNAVKSYINVVEDARIEKLIKRKFPGLRKNMFKGYAELLERDFFGTNGRELTSYKLIDRLNLHFKVGSHVSIPFSDDEMKIVKRIESLDSFEDVISCVRDIYNGEKSDTDTHMPDDTSDTEPSDETGDPSDESSNESNSSDDTEFEDGPESESSEDIEDEETTQENYNDSNSSGDVEESETQNAFDDALDSERDTYSDDYVYASIPFVDSSPYIVDIKTVNTQITSRNLNLWDDTLSQYTLEFKKFVKDSTKTVNYLAKEFEMKKNAEQYARANTSKTGVIDTNKLHSYRFNDDVFRRVTSLPGGKNHGLLMFVDWSGSMSNDMGNTIRQTMILAMFCRKVSIPFDVYSFTSVNNQSEEVDRSIESLQPGNISISPNLRFRHYMTSDMRNKEFNETLFNMFVLSKLFESRYAYSSCFGLDQLGSTPLNEAIIVADDIYAKFQQKHRLEKVNVIFLTDGQSDGSYVVRDEDDENFRSFRLGWYSRRDETPTNYIVDPKTKKSIGVLTNSSITDALIRHFAERNNTNVIGFFISEKSLRNAIDLHINPDNTLRYEEMTNIKKQWRKEKCLVIDHRGYSKFFIIMGGKNLNADNSEFDVASDASKAKIRNAFKKHLTSKLGNKVILNSFIDVIS